MCFHYPKPIYLNPSRVLTFHPGGRTARKQRHYGGAGREAAEELRLKGERGRGSGRLPLLPPGVVTFALFTLQRRGKTGRAGHAHLPAQAQLPVPSGGVKRPLPPRGRSTPTAPVGRDFPLPRAPRWLGDDQKAQLEAAGFHQQQPEAGRSSRGERRGEAGRETPPACGAGALLAAAAAATPPRQARCEGRRRQVAGSAGREKGRGELCLCGDRKPARREIGIEEVPLTGHTAGSCHPISCFTQ